MKKKIFFLLLSAFFLYAGRVQVCIDPGHGGIDPGCENPRYGQSGPYEREFNLEIADYCKNELFGYLTYSMTRINNGTFVSLKDRVKIAKGEKESAYPGGYDTCDVFVSIHNNAPRDANSYTHGTETYANKAIDEDFATFVHASLYNYISGMPYAYNRGVVNGNKHVLRETHCPACLCECAFVTHDQNSLAQWFQLSGTTWPLKEFAGMGIALGIMDYYTCIELELLRILQHIFKGQEQNSVVLEWTPLSGCTHFNIYRATYPSNTYYEIASNYSGTIYYDNNVTSGGIYSYYVKGATGGGSIPSNMVTAQLPPFSSDCSIATGLNNGKKIIFDDTSVSHLTYANLEGIWYVLSTDYGNNWSVTQKIDYGWQPAITFNDQDSPLMCYISDLGEPHQGAGETLTYTINYAWLENDIWHDEILYETYDSILSVSFAIDPLDTGWVVFNTYDDEGNNELKIGQFYTQTLPESLENITTLDTYNSYGKAAVVVRPSDRSIWIVYERNNTIMYKWRNIYGNWITGTIQNEGVYPSLSTAGDLIHFIWEKYYSETDRREIQTCYTSGFLWTRPQTIAVVRGENCYPYIEKGSLAVWADLYINQWEVYSSQRTESGNWTTPQNISQTPTDSKYPQVAMYQTVSQTNLVYVWTEGDNSPYEVKILPVSLRSNPVPLYAFNLGREEPCAFLERRSGYIAYGQGFEKTVDYDSSFIRYVITGLDSARIYHIGLVLYQDEEDSIWQQGVEIDNELVKVVDLHRRRVVFEKIVLSPETYEDGRISLNIRSLLAPKAVLAALAVWEFSEENKTMASVQDFNDHTPKTFSVFTSPNPARGNLLLHYQLPSGTADISIKIYSVSGQLIREITENKRAGMNTVIWDGKDDKGTNVAGGIYFYRVESRGEVKTGKIVFLR